MGNANTHERRKSGVPETGLTIENIREKPRVEEAALVTTKPGVQSEKTPPPSFETGTVTEAGDELHLRMQRGRGWLAMG